MMNSYAVLLDTVSIQHYIYSSSRLNENTGASFLVEKAFNGYLEEALKKVFPDYKKEMDHWQDFPGEILIEDDSVPWEVGYIGGGNALLFFQNESTAKLFLEEWSTALLVNAPGIVCAATNMEFNFDNFYQSKEKLFKQLEENKNRCIPLTVIARHGITAECSGSGLSQEYWNSFGDPDQQGWVSSTIAAKINNAKEAKNELEQEFKESLFDKDNEQYYCFTDQLDQLGQRKDKDSHIAIVHIDGNSMAQRFEAAKELTETRNLSKSVRKALRTSFACLLKEIIASFSIIQETLGFTTPKEKEKYPNLNGKPIIPLRPILLGGDDITFVCNGKLGIYFAQLFLEYFTKQKVSDGQALSACAGIAITKTKFPFYRGYELSEQLCANAKTQRIKEDAVGDDVSPSSWLDFHITLGGVSGSIEKIREYHYIQSNKELLFRPFRLGGNDKRDFYTFIRKTGELYKKLSGSKRMELRDALTAGEAATETFAVALAAKGITLPVIPGYNTGKNLWLENKTPYFDMIELCEFYPTFLMENKQEIPEEADEKL